MHPASRQAFKPSASDSTSRAHDIVTSEGEINPAFRERVIESANRKAQPCVEVFAAVEGILETWRDDPDQAARELDAYLDD
jgi:hypothetical protein